MTFQIPEGATPLFTISIDPKTRKAVSTPAPNLDDIAEELTDQIRDYTERVGDIPPFLRAWQELANDVARHQAEKAKEP